MRRTFALLVGAVLALTACGAGGGGKPAGVASLSGSGSGSGSGRGPTTTVGKQNASELYTKWAQCMRDHGINIADPVVDAQGQINIALPQGLSIQTYQTADTSCKPLHEAAQTAARGGKAADKPDPTKALNFSKCMRAHGLPDFPDPSPGGGLQIRSGPGSDVNPNNPTFQAAQKACQSIMGSPKGGERVTGGGFVSGGKG
jgi:hypothetical protein